MSNDAPRRGWIAGFDTLTAVVACAFAPSRAMPQIDDGPAMSRLVDLARRHRVQGLVASVLGDHAPEALMDEARRIATHNLRAAAESQRLLRSFTAAGVNLLFLKGLTVGALAWPRPMAKMSWDIDVLIASDDLRVAARILEQLGYRQHRPVPPRDLVAWHLRVKESEWSLDSVGLQLELHSRATENLALMPRIDVSAPRQEVPVVGGLPLPTFAPAPLFAYLCVHGATSAWFRLKWLADLAALVHRAGPTQTATWIAEAGDWTHPRIVGQAMVLTERLFGPLIPASALASLAADPVVQWLSSIALTELAGPRSLIEPTERRLGTLGIHLSQLRLRPGWQFAVKEAWRQWREMRSGG